MKKAILILGIIIAGITGVVFGQDYAAIAKNSAAKTDLILSGSTACNCDITIPASAWYVDIDKKTNTNAYVIAPKPGQTVCFADGVRGPIELHNINAASGSPITFASCSGTTLKGTAGQHVVQFFNSSFVRVSSEQGPIDITGGGHGLYFRDLSTDVEANGIYFHDLGYSGFEAKTDPTCDPKTWRGAFTLRNPVVKNCRFVNIATGEAIYIGESHYHTTFPLSGCASGVKSAQEHDVVGATVTGCSFEHIGRDAIQIGASTGMVVTNNKIKDFGYTKEYGQGSGVTWNPGSTGEVAYNTIDTGSGFGILAQGRGSGKIHHNVVLNTGTPVDGGGIMLAAYAPIDAAGYEVYNNTMEGVNRVGLEYYSAANVRDNIINVVIGAQLVKKAGTVTIVIPASNIQLIGNADGLKLDPNYTPLIGSPAYRDPLDAGAMQSIKPPKVVTYPATVEVVQTGDLVEVFVLYNGLRVKIK
jgi:hypothetical protein